MRTDYLGLEAFVAIAELGSFSRAAAFLNLSQTALSHRIKKLEAELGFQLFIRSTRDVSLTKEAQEILYREHILWRYQVQNAAMALSLVAEGAAMTILPSLMANLAWQELTALPFSDVEMKRTLGLVTRRGVSLSAPSHRLIGMITQRLGALPYR